MHTELLITGMRDNCCREKIAEVVSVIPGVDQVDVSLFRAVARVVHETSCPVTRIIAAIEDAGFGAAVTQWTASGSA